MREFDISGRNIICDFFFASLELVSVLFRTIRAVRKR